MAHCTELLYNWVYIFTHRMVTFAPKYIAIQAMSRHVKVVEASKCIHATMVFKLDESYIAPSVLKKHDSEAPTFHPTYIYICWMVSWSAYMPFTHESTQPSSVGD